MSGPVLVVTILFSKSREFDRASSTGPMCCGAPTQQDTGKNPKSPKNPTASALKYDTGKRHASALSLFLPEDNIEHNAKESEEPSVNNPRVQKEPFALPSWCRYIGWFVSLAASLWITYYILLLSFEWGVGISQMWLLAVACVSLHIYDHLRSWLRPRLGTCRNVFRARHRQSTVPENNGERGHGICPRC